MADDELDRLVKEFHQFALGESKRMAQISTMARVISGDIPLNEVRLPDRLRTIFQPKKYQPVWSFHNPAKDPSLKYLLIKYDDKDEDAHFAKRDLIMDALRAADAPLPSGRPPAERVFRTTRFKGHLQAMPVQEDVDYLVDKHSHKARAHSAAVFRGSLVR